jgi:muramidase (phage lysozyme)
MLIGSALNRKSFLDLIAWSEGTSRSSITKCDGYDVIINGPEGAEIFSNFSDHPFAHRRAKLVKAPNLFSTASGRYQLLYRYWAIYRISLNLPDFSPSSQDAVTLKQIEEKGGLIKVDSGDFQGAVESCSNIWASFPGNNFAQAGGHSLETLLDRFSILRGKYLSSEDV